MPSIEPLLDEDDLYAEVAGEYCDFYGRGEDAFHSLLVFGAAELLRRGGMMLDVGCGPGIALDWMDVSPSYYVGLDPSGPMLAEARRRHPGHLFLESRFETAPVIRADAFELVLGAFGPLMHVVDLEPFAAKLNEVLAPGGRFMLMGAGTEYFPVRILDGRPHRTFYHSPAELAAVFGGTVYELAQYLVVTNA